MEGQIQAGDTPLDTAPKAVQLAVRLDAKAFLYPDPPFTIEKHPLLHDLRPVRLLRRRVRERLAA
jgi:hypothetical protein